MVSLLTECLPIVVCHSSYEPGSHVSYKQRLEKGREELHESSRAES